MTPRRKQPLSELLGPLEMEVMEIVWERGTVTVRDVYDELKEQRPIAYTTVMTTMARLAEKGLLEREDSQPAHLFSALVSREEYVRSTVKSVVDWLVNQFPDPAVSYFLNRVEREDPAVIERLRRAIRQQESRNKGG